MRMGFWIFKAAFIDWRIFEGDGRTLELVVLRVNVLEVMMGYPFVFHDLLERYAMD